jgi:predicted metallo-beta-lactamase superfamily hydrolase
MKVLPLAADSLGVHSMATLVTGAGGSLLIDPGALAGETASPTGSRLGDLAAARAAVVGAAARSAAVFVTSYAPVHHNLLPDCPPHLPVYLKNPDTVEELRQARALIAALAAPGRTIAFAAGAAVSIAGFAVECSGGAGAMTVCVRHGERTFIHASTALNHRECAAVSEHIIAAAPDLLYLSGAPLHRLSDPAVDEIERALSRRALRSLLHIVRTTGCLALVDHELVRVPDFRRLYAPAFATQHVFTVADFQPPGGRNVTPPAVPGAAGPLQPRRAAALAR